MAAIRCLLAGIALVVLTSFAGSAPPAPKARAKAPAVSAARRAGAARYRVRYIWRRLPSGRWVRIAVRVYS